MKIPLPTDRQVESLAQIKAELKDRYGLVERLDFSFHEEARPGRGHALMWFCCDGEMLATGQMDVYGGTDYGVAQLDWIHSSSDDECECEHCDAEREAK